jgi:hypothetical protein
MSIHQKFRGAAPVGQLGELPVLEMSAIVYFRMLGTSIETRQQLHQDFQLAFGRDHGIYYAAQFEEFFTFLATKSRRKVMRHEIDCTCFGGDESAIANMIALAAIGDIQEAELLASNLVPCKDAKTLVAHAEAIGLALSLMLEKYPLPVLTQPSTPSTKH